MTALAMIFFSLAVWSRVLVTKGENEKDFTLHHQVIGLVKHEDKPLEWNPDFENPLTELSINTRANVENQLRQTLNSISIHPENLYTVLWNKNNEVWADLAFCFRPENYTKIKYWNKGIAKAVENAVNSSYEKRDALTHLMYRSFIKEPELTGGNEHSAYKTSFQVTFEVELDVKEITDEWQDTSSSIYEQKCKDVNKDLQAVFAEGDIFAPDTFKCVFFEAEGKIKAIATADIAFNSIYNTDIYKDIDNFVNDLILFFKCLNEYHEIISVLVKIIISHVPPVIYPQPATTTTIPEPTTFTTTEEPTMETTYEPEIPTGIPTFTFPPLPTLLPTNALSMSRFNFITMWTGVATSIVVCCRLN